MADLLRAEQAYFDRYFFDPDESGYDRLGQRDAKLAHIGWHVAKIVGRKMPEWFECHDEGIIKHEVIPDLAIYGTQLANEFELPEEDFRGFEHTYSVEAVDRRLRSALGDIADYIEPLEHAKQPKRNLPRQAAIKLYSSAVDLAIEFSVLDLAAAQRARMEEHMHASFPPELV